MKTTAKIMAVLGLLAFAGLASARVITIEVTGVVDLVDTDGGFALDGSVNIGSVMTGSCSYDTDTPDLDSSENSGRYALISISMAIGNYTFMHDPVSTDYPFFSVYTVDPIYVVGSEALRFDGTLTVNGSPATYDDITWNWTYLELFNLGTSSEYISTDAMPDLDSWPDLSVFYHPRRFETHFLGEGSDYFGIRGEITSLTVIPEPPKTYYVDAAEGSDNNDGLSPQTPFATIQKAIDSAYNGDTVIVADGTYTGPGNRDIDFLGKAITVRSESGPENCIIDCNGTETDPHRGFNFLYGEGPNSVLAGVTITNGYGPRYKGYTVGGAILCDGSSPTINNCIISGNWAGFGGGIYCEYGSSPTINNCTIIGNLARGPGGGIACDNSSPTITNCTISRNNAADGNGGGIFCRESDLAIINCTISSNTGYVGGGIYCYSYSSPTITNCTINGNSALAGGGIVCDVYSSPTINNCTFSRNTAKSTDWGGGGIYCYLGSSPTITNCAITDNVGSMGGGIYCEYGSSPTITNCTFNDNSAERGGAIYSYRGSNLIITNCILWANSPSQISLHEGSTASITYSDVQGGWEGEGNIDAAPVFALDTDYHLMPGSPGIDAGTNDPCGGLPATDKDGVARPLDGDGDANAVADMGAYEYAPNSPSIAVSALSFYFVQDWPKPDPQMLQIRNCGDQPLQWEIVEDCSWLEVAPANGVSTGQINEVTITVDPNFLSPGYYVCILTVLDPNAANSPVTVQVLLRVGALLRVPQHFLTIQAAIDAAEDFDMVLVADGTYTGPGNRDIDFLGKAITVRSESGPENCIIDCNGTETDPHRGFYFHNGEDANSVLDGFTVTGGYTYQGGGIFVDGSSPTIKNCIVTGNTGGWGGGVAFYNSDATIINCLISGNKGGDAAGGIYCRNRNPKITNCTISGNSAFTEGGGIACDDSNATITNCAISGNSAEWSGGGVFCMYSNPKITNCTITGNLAEWGGGIYCGGWWYGYDWQGSSPTITNCILWDNLPEQIYGHPSITYSDIQQDEWPWWDYEGNISADPCFIEPGYRDANDLWIDGDYHLLEVSPCIDAGDPNYISEPNETDLDGNPRIIGGRIDMGAYETNYIQAAMKLTPQMLNCNSKGKYVKAHLTLPEGFLSEDVDVNESAVAEPIGAESEYIKVLGAGTGPVRLEICFDREAFCAQITETGEVEIIVIGSLTTSRYFYASDTIKMKP